MSNDLLSRWLAVIAAGKCCKSRTGEHPIAPQRILHDHVDGHGRIRKQVYRGLKVRVLAQLARMRGVRCEACHCVFELMQSASERLLGRRNDHGLRRLDLLGGKCCLLSP